MKKIKSLFVLFLLFSLTGCKNDSMEDINIVTTSYPIEYVVNKLYGKHSKINSIYPEDDETINFEVTDVLLKQYSENDLFIFNGLSNEKDYLKNMLDNNRSLMIIDVTSNMNYEYSIEELWLYPNNLLTIANKTRNGFKEYINSTYLINEIDANYESLKVELTSLDAKYYSTLKNASSDTIIVSDDAFKFLEKYGINVISIDPDTAKEKTINEANNLLNNGACKYVFIKYKENTDKVKEILNNSNISTLELYNMTNLKDVQIEKNNYITLMNINLENLKVELYK